MAISYENMRELEELNNITGTRLFDRLCIDWYIHCAYCSPYPQGSDHAYTFGHQADQSLYFGTLQLGDGTPKCWEMAAGVNPDAFSSNIVM
jgi:hypothetical protein